MYLLLTSRCRLAICGAGYATAAVATVADKGGELWRELLGKVAGCFPRRETRQNAADMAGGLLMELEHYNCQSVAEAAGHVGPHRLRHLLSRAAWDDQQVLERAAAQSAGRLDDGEAVLADIPGRRRLAGRGVVHLSDLMHCRRLLPVQLSEPL